MDFDLVIGRRRMVRAYLDVPVDSDAIERIVEAGRRAPSAGFAQGQSFVIVTEAARRRRLAELAGEPAHVAAGHRPWLSQAPVHVIVTTNEDRYRERYAQPDKRASASAVLAGPIPYWWVDAGAALEALLLATVAEGMGAGFLGAHAVPGLAEELGLPAGEAPLGIVTIGHPAPEQPVGSPARRARRPRHDIVRRERWTPAT